MTGGQQQHWADEKNGAVEAVCFCPEAKSQSFQNDITTITIYNLNLGHYRYHLAIYPFQAINLDFDDLDLDLMSCCHNG